MDLLTYNLLRPSRNYVQEKTTFNDTECWTVPKLLFFCDWDLHKGWKKQVELYTLYLQVCLYTCIVSFHVIRAVDLIVIWLAIPFDICALVNWNLFDSPLTATGLSSSVCYSSLHEIPIKINSWFGTLGSGSTQN